ncbi:MAG: deoxyribose-phosphate aldolase [Clostridiales bacterium]|jgi:deoxyribose-phosphate aldolase|nr:deoxyribose-phosphate aldolase [Clostridiales bacterium]
MEAVDIFPHIDHTILKAAASMEEVEKLCEEALEYSMASVCLPPLFVKPMKDIFGGPLNICTVIGFPLGYNAPGIKAAEIERAVKDGASELDVVVSIGALKSKMLEYAAQEISECKKAAGSKLIKVIIEACYLSEDEKIAMCKAVTDAGADYIKTSTGFGSGGARIEDIILFKKHIGKNVKIKAAGGIRTKKDIEAYLEAGCERIGTSQAIKILG